MNRGRYKSAVNAAEKALTLGGEAPTLFVLASMAYREAGFIGQALALSQKATNKFPKVARIQRELRVCENLLKSEPKNATVAMVTTLIDVEDTIDSFIEYHLDIGVHSLYLFFGNSEESSFRKAEECNQVVAIRHDDD